MEEESVLKLKIILSCLLLIILWLSYLLRITNPFAFAQIPYSILDLILMGISCLIPFLNILILMSYSFKKSTEKRLFFIFLFLLVYTIIIGPGLAIHGLFNNDTFYHLYIVRNLILPKNVESLLNYGDYGEYGGYFFHKLVAITAIITNIDPHLLFLFYPQLIMFSFFFIGIYSVVFKCLEGNPDKKRYIFLLTIFFPRHLFQNAAFHPYYFLISLMPITLYFTLNLTKMNMLMLTIINIIAMQSHIYGLVFVTFSIGMIILRVIVEEIGEIQYKYILGFIWFVYGLGIIIIMNPSLIEIVFAILPLHGSIKERILTQFQSGGALFSTSGAAPHIQAVFDLTGMNQLVIIKTIFDWTIFYVPLFVVLICNQFSYVFYQRKGNKFRTGFFAQIKLLCDLFFVFFMISLFYGANLQIERIVVLVFSLYFIICIHYLLIIGETIVKKIKNLNVNKSHSFRLFLINIDRALKIIFLFGLLGFSFYTFINYRHTTIINRYEAIYWINENIPENSTFLASLSRMSNVIRGMTLLDTTSYCEYLFNSSMEENIGVYWYLKLPEFSNKSAYLIIDLIDDRKLETVWLGYPSVGKDPPCVSIDKALEMVSNSSHYNLVYNNTEILIYEMILYP